MKVSTSIILILFLTICVSLDCHAQPSEARLPCCGIEQNSGTAEGESGTDRKACIGDLINKAYTLLKNVDFKIPNCTQLIDDCTKQVSTIKGWFNSQQNQTGTGALQVVNQLVNDIPKRWEKFVNCVSTSSGRSNSSDHAEAGKTNDTSTTKTPSLVTSSGSASPAALSSGRSYNTDPPEAGKTNNTSITTEAPYDLLAVTSREDPPAALLGDEDTLGSSPAPNIPSTSQQNSQDHLFQTQHPGAPNANIVTVTPVGALGTNRPNDAEDGSTVNRNGENQRTHAQGGIPYGSNPESIPDANLMAASTGASPGSNTPPRTVGNQVLSGNNYAQSTHNSGNQQPKPQGPNHQLSQTYGNGESQKAPDGIYSQANQPTNAARNSVQNGNNPTSSPFIPNGQQSSSQGSYGYVSGPDTVQNVGYPNGQTSGGPANLSRQENQQTNVARNSVQNGNNPTSSPFIPNGQQSSSQGSYGYVSGPDTVQNAGYPNGQTSGGPANLSPQGNQQTNVARNSVQNGNNPTSSPFIPNGQQSSSQGSYGYVSGPDTVQNVGYPNGQTSGGPANLSRQGNQQTNVARNSVQNGNNPTSSPFILNGQQSSSQGSYGYVSGPDTVQNAGYPNGQTSGGPANLSRQGNQQTNMARNSVQNGNNPSSSPFILNGQQSSSQGSYGYVSGPDTVQNVGYPIGQTSGGPARPSSQQIERTLSIDEIRKLGVLDYNPGEKIFINVNNAAALVGEFQHETNQVRLYWVDNEPGIVNGRGIVVNLTADSLVRLIGCREVPQLQQ